MLKGQGVVALLKLLGLAEPPPVRDLASDLCFDIALRCAVLAKPVSIQRSGVGFIGRGLRSFSSMRSSSASLRRWAPKFRGFRRHGPPNR
jgi:hypothetical protein